MNKAAWTFSRSQKKESKNILEKNLEAAIYSRDQYYDNWTRSQALTALQ